MSNPLRLNITFKGVAKLVSEGGDYITLPQELSMADIKGVLVHRKMDENDFASTILYFKDDEISGDEVAPETIIQQIPKPPGSVQEAVNALKAIIG